MGSQNHFFRALDDEAVFSVEIRRVNAARNALNYWKDFRAGDREIQGRPLIQ